MVLKYTYYENKRERKDNNTEEVSKMIGDLSKEDCT